MNEERLSRERFASWVDDHSSVLLRFAYRMTGQMSSAEDLVQETFQQAWQSMHRLRDPGAAPAWLFRILRTRYARWIKNQRRNSQLSIDQLDGEGNFVSAATAAQHQRVLDHDELHVALSKLEDRFKEPLLLVVMEEMPVADVSRILKLRRGTVLSRVHRAKQKLARIIEAMREHPRDSDTSPTQPDSPSANAQSNSRGHHARSL